MRCCVCSGCGVAVCCAIVLAEAAAVGVAGSLLGIGLGYAIARTALAFGGADLGAGMFRGITPEPAFRSSTACFIFSAAY
jgi:putative ABC transport system permease protein